MKLIILSKVIKVETVERHLSLGSVSLQCDFFVLYHLLKMEKCWYILKRVQSILNEEEQVPVI